MRPEDTVFIAGSRGLVGSAVTRALQARGFSRLLLPSSSELDLCDQAATRAFFERERPRYVIMAAAKVGGILANDTFPADFIGRNLQIQVNVNDACRRFGVEKQCFLGSTCIYPRLAPQPMPESCLLTGELEPTNQWYAIAKIAGVLQVMAEHRQHGQRGICLMPTNLYGPGDNFDPQTSHVLPAFIRRFHEARLAGTEVVTCWGSGAPRREFLHVDDCAEAICFLMEHHEDPGPINVGCGEDLPIRDLAELVAEVVGYRGRIEWDTTKPDGAPRKLVDTTRINALGWRPRIALREGLAMTYHWYTGQVAGAVG